MRSNNLLALFSVIFTLSACTTFHVAGQVQRGREAMFREDPKAALPHFQRAAQLDPNYLAYVSPLTEGVWTYTGRAHYEMNQLPEAQKMLEQAVSRTEYDYFAKLYLGLTLGRSGNRQEGLRHVEVALKGFYGALDDDYQPDADFWDSTGELRGVIRRQLASISGKEFAWPDLISTGEWLGERLEEEIDLSRELKRRADTRDGEDAKDDD